MSFKLNKINFNEDKSTFYIKLFNYENSRINNKINKYDLNDFYITGQVQVFGVEKLNNFKENNSTFQILDKDKGISIIFRFQAGAIIIQDIIECDNIFIAEGMSFRQI